jgi:MFS family permease
MLTLGLVLTITLVAFEALAVATIMPIVGRELGGLDLYGWVFSAFFLGSLLGIVVVGGSVDRRGLVVPFAVGLVLFSTGLIVGGLAPSMEVLVGARFVQGLGAGAIPPIAYVSIGRALPESLRPRMFATLSTAWVLPGVIGPALSGAVAETFGWRWVFLGLLPLIAVAGAMTIPAIRRDVPDAILHGGSDTADGDTEAPPAGHRTAAGRIRLAWAVVLALGAALVLAALTSASLIPGLPLLVGGVALLVPAIRSLTPAGTLRAAAGMPAAILLRGVLTFAFFAADAYVPLALQGWRGVSATVAGIALTAATLSWTGGAWIQARYVERLGLRWFVRRGFAVVAVGIVAFAAILSPGVPLVLGVLAWAIAGLGMGLSYSPLSLAVLRDAPGGGEGASTSALSLMDTLGSAVGAGAGGAIIAFAARSGAEGWAGLAVTFALGTIAALIGVGLAGRIHGPVRALRSPTGIAAARREQAA